MPNHQQIDQRSLAFGQAIARELQQRPELIDHAKATLSRWLSTCSSRSRATLDEWSSILAGPRDGVIAVLTREDERSVRLRQSNPFAGVLSPQERNAIIRRFQSHDALSA